MAVDTRYQTIDDLPEAGINLACAPALANYSGVLNEAQKNQGTRNGGASYNESDIPTREISYVYALNSIYRDLNQWQNERNNLEDNVEVAGLRQEIRDIFPYFMNSEFPQPADAAPNYVINDDFIQIDTKNIETNQIINPLSFSMDEAHAQSLDAFLQKIDAFIEKRHKEDAASKGGNSLINRNLSISLDFIRKMQFFIARKAQGRQVFDFRTTEEKSRTFRNGFIRNIENVLQTQKNKNVSFAKSTQEFSDFLDSNGMQVVWYQEPPYESEFVNHLDEMKQDLLGDTPDNFYNTKLPVFMDLCKNLHEFNPTEAASLKAQMDDFLNAPDKSKLAAAIEEAKRVSLDLQETDFVKSRVMRAAWDGMIANQPKKRLSPFMQEILLIREHLVNPNASEEMKQKIADYTSTHYKPEDYDLSQSKVWNICKQVPQFAQLEDALSKKICAMDIPPQKIAEFTYADVAYLLNHSVASRTKSFADNEGLAVASDKCRYFKELVANNEAELRKSLQSYYQQKFTMQLINDGVAQKKSDIKIQKKVAAEAEAAAESVIADMRAGRANKDFNGHHNFALSNIAYFEKVTGKPFTEINQHIVLINKDFHDLIHLNENNVDRNGQIRMNQNITHRTKYVPQNMLITKNNRISGYMGRALSFAVMAKSGIKAMIDFRSFIFDKETLQENIRAQQQMIDYRKEQKNKFNNLTVPHLDLPRLRQYMDDLLKPAEGIELGNQAELQKARQLDKMNRERRGNIAVIDKTPQPKRAPSLSNNPNRALSWHLKNKNKKTK